jgi:hypothetical protein
LTNNPYARIGYYFDIVGNNCNSMSSIVSIAEYSVSRATSGSTAKPAFKLGPLQQLQLSSQARQQRQQQAVQNQSGQ